MQTNIIEVRATQYTNNVRTAQDFTAFEATLTAEQAAQLIYRMLPSGNATLSGSEIKINTDDKDVITYFTYSHHSKVSA